MPKPSNFEIMEKAREMGLKLSEDGKSWVPIDEIVVQLPPPRNPAYIPGTTRKILTSIIFWMIICFLFAYSRSNLNSRLWFVFITVFQGLDFSDESWRDDMTDYLSEVAQQTENVNIEYENSAIGKTEDKMYEAIDKFTGLFKRKK